ncbi:HAD family hydrolase [Bacillus cereus]|uniref:HAD family hydrolase n=1 Tax=Bacillus cereus TaxID=1396 RepID=UPI00065B6B61|nr:HAD family hydrolase [Bacillus cereus]KMQ32167.1 haloacid dehalogenase [Bacillus cereus]
MGLGAVVFDFDGVIIDSKEVQCKAFFQSYGKVVGEGTPDFEEFLSHAGNSLDNIFELMNLPQEMIVPYREFSSKNIHQIKMFNGMQELIKELYSMGIKIGLCTGKDRQRTLDILSYHQLLSFFDVIVCSDDVRNPKPSPDSLLACMEELNVSCEETVMIGDAANDIICAQSCNVFSIAVLWGESKLENLKLKNPDAICSTVVELRDTLLKKVNNTFIYKKMLS